MVAVPPTSFVDEVINPRVAEVPSYTVEALATLEHGDEQCIGQRKDVTSRSIASKAVPLV
jgi:hypothetical protein